MTDAKYPLPWEKITTVLLDMDGTLLDLHFDSYFWREYMPRRYASSRGLDVNTATTILNPLFQRTHGTLDWYCLDYWSKQLNLDIALLKRDVAQLIRFKPGADQFLTSLRGMGKRLVLVTNAHHKSLALKLEKTRLDNYLDELISAHDFRVPKEQVTFWSRLQEREPFTPANTLLIDDNLAALRAAQQFGIKHLLAVKKPSSQAPQIDTGEFHGLDEFAEILPFSKNG